MNRNKPFLCSVCSLFLLLCVFAACAFICYANDVFSGDARCIYAPSIDTGYLTNWHSPCFMLQCLALQKVFVCCFGINLNGRDILTLVAVLCSCMIWGVGCMQLAHWQHEKWLCISAAFVLSFVYFWSLVQCHIGLDFFFVAWATLAVYIVGKSCDVVGEISKGKMIFNFFLLSFAFAEMLACRRNSLFLVLYLYAFWFCFSLRKMHISRVRVLALSLIFSGFVFLLVEKSPACVTHIVKLYPTAPMMVSDMRISHLLRGKERENNACLREDEGHALYASYTCTPLRNGSFAHELFLPVDEASEADKFANLCSRYSDEWIKYPDSMLSARLLQLFHMWVPMSSGWVESLMSTRYPAIHHKCCTIYVPHKKAQAILTTVEHVLTMLILLGAFVACLRFSRTNRTSIQQILGKIRLYSVSALMYAAGYLVVVPTSDARYLNPCFYLSIVAGVYCFFLLFQLRKVEHG